MPGIPSIVALIRLRLAVAAIVFIFLFQMVISSKRRIRTADLTTCYPAINNLLIHYDDALTFEFIILSCALPTELSLSVREDGNRINPFNVFIMKASTLPRSRYPHGHYTPYLSSNTKTEKYKNNLQIAAHAWTIEIYMRLDYILSYSPPLNDLILMSIA